MLTGELEQTLQDEYNLTPEEAQKIGKAWQLAGLLTPQQNTPGKTLRNPDTGEELTVEEIKELRKKFPGAPIPTQESEFNYRNSLATSIGKLLVKKEFGIPEEFNQQKQQKAYKDAGPSSLEVVLRKISEEAELETDDFIKNIPEAYKRLGVKGVTEIYDEMTGTGFISAGPAEDEANRLKEANLYGGRTITAGRYISDAVLGIENERADFWVSGLIDAAALIFLDPATYVTFGLSLIHI